MKAGKTRSNMANLPDPLLMASSIVPEDQDRIEKELPARLHSLENSKLHSLAHALAGQVKLAYSMLFDKSFSMKWKSKALLIAGLLYFIIPADFVPDYIPFVGYVDDTGVLASIFKILASEIAEYKLFKQNNISE
jgi:uncharacterized membrane protein YkvA (DUF1232 family)